VEALTGHAALERAREDAAILDELEQAAKSERGALVDEYARLRDQLKAQQREIQDLKRKLATGASPGFGDAVREIGQIRVWTPRFEDLDRKAHASVIDEFRNTNRERDYVVLSCALSERGVHVIAAVSASLAGRLTAPDLMKRLGLRGGGRPDFAQGGGVEADGIQDLHSRADALIGEVAAPGRG
jgi:alanyl-tRNA synthetase